MAWTKLTRDDLTATLSQREIDARSRSSGFSDDAADAQLAQTAATVRGFVRAGGTRLPAEAELIPPSLVPFALDFAAYRLLKRFNVAVGEERRKAYESAMEIFKQVAERKLAVEPADDAEAEEAAIALSPAVAPPNPARMLD